MLIAILYFALSSFFELAYILGILIYAIFLQILETGPLIASVEITVPLGEHGGITVIAMVQADCPYLAFKAEVGFRFLSKIIFKLKF